MFSKNHKFENCFYIVTLFKDNCKTLKIAEKLVFKEDYGPMQGGRGDNVR